MLAPCPALHSLRFTLTNNLLLLLLLLLCALAGVQGFPEDRAGDGLPGSAGVGGMASSAAVAEANACHGVSTEHAACAKGRLVEIEEKETPTKGVYRVDFTPLSR